MSSSDEPAAKRARAGPDLKIVVDDGELEVRSQILEFASPVFANMLNSAMKEGSGTSIKLPGKNKSELEAFYNSLHICSMKPLTRVSCCKCVGSCKMLPGHVCFFLMGRRISG